MQASQATEADIPALCELLGVLFAQETEFQPDHGRQEAGLRAVLGRPEVGRVLVLRDGPDVIGMVALLWLPSTALGGPVALLEDMVVRPDRRGSGAGSMLLTEAIECAQARGCLRLTLLMDRSNQAAQRFYERHGFVMSEMAPMRLLLNRTEAPL